MDSMYKLYRLQSDYVHNGPHKSIGLDNQYPCFDNHVNASMWIKTMQQNLSIQTKTKNNPFICKTL